MAKAPPASILAVIDQLAEGASLRPALAASGVSHWSFYAAIKRDPALAATYVEAKQGRMLPDFEDAVAIGRERGAKAMMSFLHAAGKKEVRRDWEAIARAESKRRQARQFERDDIALQQIDQRQAQRHRRAATLAAAPATLTKIDDLKAVGDVIDARVFRKLGLHQNDMVFRDPPRQPGLSRIELTRDWMALHYRSGACQTVSIFWWENPVNTCATFVCGPCGKRARMLYPHPAGDRYVCRRCVTATADGRYAARQKRRDPKRVRTKPPVFAGVRCTTRDPATGRLSRPAPPPPRGFKLHDF